MKKRTYFFFALCILSLVALLILSILVYIDPIKPKVDRLFMPCLFALIGSFIAICHETTKFQNLARDYCKSYTLDKLKDTLQTFQNNLKEANEARLSLKTAFALTIREHNWREHLVAIAAYMKGIAIAKKDIAKTTEIIKVIEKAIALKTEFAENTTTDS